MLFRPREVAERLGISISFAKKLITDRRLRVVRVGTAVRVPLDELERVEREGLGPSGMKTPGREADPAPPTHSAPKPSRPARGELMAAVPLDWIRKLRAYPNEMVVLLTVMAFAYRNRNGRCLASNAMISKAIGVDATRVGRHISALEAKGFLRRVLRPGRSNEIFVELPEAVIRQMRGAG